jgi:hypothetical protein
MIETRTIRRTPARAPSSCMFRVAAVKKSVAACCSGEAPLVASTRESTSRNASARPSPVTTSIPAEREIATTSRPCSSSTSTTWRPTLPVTPATAIFPRVFISAPFSFDSTHDPIVLASSGGSHRGGAQVRTEVFRPPHR